MRLETIPLERLEQEITELAAHIHAATCRWLCMVAEFDRREGWAQWGSKSCAHWLSWTCGLAAGAAREQLRVARRLGELPGVREAFAAGELSFSKVRAVTRVATAETEEDLVMLARHSSAAQLERLVRGYRSAASAQLETANRTHRDRYLTWEWDDDGSLVLRGRLPADEGAQLVAALEAARDALGVSAETPVEVPPTDDADVPAGTPRARTNADAVGLMAQTLLAHGTARAPGGDRYQVVVHVDATRLRDDHSDGRCRLDNGPAIPAETARRLACDASIVPIVEADGRPLSVGRQTRSIPPSIRRALRSRDHGCCFPGCTQRRFVDAHHIDHWAHGGETKLSNLLLLCRHHHRLVHEGGYRVEQRRGGELAFRGPDGRAIPAVPPPHRGDPGAPARRNRRAGLALHPETCVARSAGQHLDYGLAVEGLLAKGGSVSAAVPGPRHVADERHASADRAPFG